MSANQSSPSGSIQSPVVPGNSTAEARPAATPAGLAAGSRTATFMSPPPLRGLGLGCECLDMVRVDMLPDDLSFLDQSGLTARQVTQDRDRLPICFAPEVEPRGRSEEDLELDSSLHPPPIFRAVDSDILRAEERQRVAVRAIGCRDVERAGDTYAALANGQVQSVSAAHEPGAELCRRRVVDVGRRGDLLDTPAVHDGHAVGDRHRLGLVVGHVDGGDSDALLDQSDLVAQVSAYDGVQG